MKNSGFGGLEASVLAFGTRVRGFKPGRSRRIFRGKKSSAPLPSEGEVKPKVTWKSLLSAKFSAISGVRLRRFRRWTHLVWRRVTRSKSLVLQVGG